MAVNDSDARFTRREFGALLTGALAGGAIPRAALAQARAAASASPGPILDILSIW